jgi:hypothetical protein
MNIGGEAGYASLSRPAKSTPPPVAPRVLIYTTLVLFARRTIPRPHSLFSLLLNVDKTMARTKRGGNPVSIVEGPAQATRN